jgi:hypothetical protein
MIHISISRQVAKAFLQGDMEDGFIVVCRGYDGYDGFTELVYPDDKDLDFDDESYYDFELWIKVPDEDDYILPL